MKSGERENREEKTKETDGFMKKMRAGAFKRKIPTIYYNLTVLI